MKSDAKSTIRFLVMGIFIIPVLLLTSSQVLAYSITSGIDTFNIQFLPAIPGSDMSIDWGGYSASASVTAAQRSTNDSHENRSWDSFDTPTDTTITATTSHNATTVDILEYDALFTVDFSDDTPDNNYLSSNGQYNLRQDFTVSGDGWLLISTSHEANFDSTANFDLDYYSRANLYLRNTSYWRDNDSDYSSLREDSTDLSHTIGVGGFFRDGEGGYFTLSLYDSFNNHGSPVPIPSGVYLLGSGILGLMLVGRRGR
jgi:hypothetical protein